MVHGEALMVMDTCGPRVPTGRETDHLMMSMALGVIGKEAHPLVISHLMIDAQCPDEATTGM